MLDVLRKRKRSWLILTPLAVIIITFVLFYGGSGLQDPGMENVAEVNGEVISQREFAFHYQRMLERYRDLFKGSLTPELIQNLNLKSALLEELIQRRLLLQEARRLELTATDDDLMNAIASIPEFQENGRFNKERYLQLLRVNNLTPGQFEAEQREQMTIQKLRNIILDAVHIAEAEVRNRYRFEQERVNFYFVRLPLSDYLPQVKVSEEEIAKFYENNQPLLREPLRVQVEYLTYPFDRFADAVKVSEKEIKDYYEANRDTKFRTPQGAKVRHIFIRAPEGADTAQKDAARARANRILAEARAGKDFAELAKKHSDDPSAAQGGDVGWLTKGQMLAALDQAVFGLPEGGISDVIETAAGYHIVKVEEVRAEKTQSLKEASPEIVRTLKAEKGKREAANAADRGREKLLAGTDFSELARQGGVSAKVTRWFASSEVLQEIGPVQEFYKTAFSLSPREISPVIEGSAAYYLMRLKDRKEPAVPPLESVRSDIEKRLRERKALDLLGEKASALLEQLKREKDIQALAKQHNLSVQETGWFIRSAPEIPKIGNLPDAKPGGIAISSYKPIPEQVFTQNDAAYLIAFKDSRGADMERFEKEKDRLIKEALAESQQRVMQRFVDMLKAKAQIQIHAQSLEAS